YTVKKLIRLVRADNAQDFHDQEWGNTGTYFVKGTSFTPSSNPSSENNAGDSTGVSLDSIANAAEIVSSAIGIVSTPTAHPSPSPAGLAAASFSHVEHFLQAAVDAHGGTVNLDEIEQLDRSLSSATSQEIAGLWNKLSAKFANDNQSTQLDLMLKT